ncbi:MAG: hypothetical protein F4Z31_05285 [Gemmatimonadetes bacterium]|nr:hypothetical protein [Gemmatimonadota bacterium]
MLTATEIKDLLESELPKNYTVSVTPDGLVRVKTPFSYPDNKPIEVYVEPEWDQYVVGDRGKTRENFLKRTGKERLGDDEKGIGDDCTRRLSVDFILKGEVRSLPDDPSDLGPIIVETAGACHAIAATWARR